MYIYIYTCSLYILIRTHHITVFGSEATATSTSSPGPHSAATSSTSSSSSSSSSSITTIITIIIIISSSSRYCYYVIQTANLRARIVDLREFDSRRTLILRGGIPRPMRNFPEMLSQIILVKIISIRRLGAIKSESPTPTRAPDDRFRKM